MEAIKTTIQQAIGQIGTIRIIDIIDIVIVTVLLYFIIDLIRRTQTSKVFTGILMILAALWLSGEIQLHTVNYILRNAVQIGLLALVVLFQPEIRRFLERLGTGSPFVRIFGGAQVQTAEAAITQTVEDQIRTGTIVDAETTAELLKNIFYPKAPLHDGAVIIRNGRIEAAGCMLPLSSNPNLSRDLGMRHRAGIGMSEATDALVVIVSEETGAISVAEKGMLKRHLTKETFEKILRNGLLTEENSAAGINLFRRKDKGEKNES